PSAAMRPERPRKSSPMPLSRIARRALLALAVLPALALAQAGAGFREIRVTDPVGGGAMPGYVFYPTDHAGKGMTRVRSYDVEAAADAPPRAGAKPFVVISHGNGGSALGHHELAAFLAAHGFVVATLEHPRDNFHDTSGVGNSSVLVGRPIQ